MKLNKLKLTVILKIGKIKLSFINELYLLVSDIVKLHSTDKINQYFKHKDYVLLVDQCEPRTRWMFLSAIHFKSTFVSSGMIKL